MWAVQRYAVRRVILCERKKSNAHFKICPCIELNYQHHAFCMYNDDLFMEPIQITVYSWHSIREYMRCIAHGSTLNRLHCFAAAYYNGLRQSRSKSMSNSQLPLCYTILFYFKMVKRAITRKCSLFLASHFPTIYK